MKKWLFLSLIAVLVLASCAADGLPDPDDLEWCYIYDFTLSDYEFEIFDGQWIEGLGLATYNGALRFNYTKPGLTPQPALVVVRFNVMDGVETDTKVTAKGDVFGVDMTINETIPIETPEELLYKRFGPAGPGDSGQSIFASIQAENPIVIQQLEVYGDGASPFATNPCGPESATGTPTTTSTPSVTATRTSSLTPTQTLSPTATSPLSCTITYDFTVSDYGFVPVAFFEGGGVFGTHGGSGWTANDGKNTALGWSRMVHLSKSFASVSVSQIDLHFTRSGGTIVNGNDWWRIVINGSIVASNASPATGTFTRSWTGSATLNNLEVFARASLQSTASYSGSATVTSVSITGIFPSCNPTHTPTPTLQATTNTPVPTATRTPSRTPLFTSGPGDGGTPTITRTPTRTSIMVFTWTPQPPSVTPAPTLPPPTLDVTPTYITVTPQTYTPEASSTVNPVTPSGTPGGTPGGTPWGTPIYGGTPYGTPSGWQDVPGKRNVFPWLATAAAEVNKLPDALTGYVPNPNTSQLLSYAKWVLSCTSAQELLGMTIAPIACHVMVGITLAIIIVGIYMSIRIARMCVYIAYWIFNQIGNFVQLLVQFLGMVLGINPVVAIGIALGLVVGSQVTDTLEYMQALISMLVEVLGMLMGIIVGVFVAIGVWVFQVVTLIGHIFSVYTTIYPTAIPGLPQCVTAPTQYELCAFYYIADWTFLAPNTPGALIIPLIVVIVDIAIVFFFARRIFSLLGTGEKVADV